MRRVSMHQVMSPCAGRTIRTLVMAAISAALFAGLLPTIAAHAQQPAWPTKPIRFIVPFPPGGTLDQFSRRVQPLLAKELGTQIVIENKAGASGSIGTAFVAQAAPDGYTILMVFDTHAVNPTLIANLPFDTLGDLAPVMRIGWAPMLLASHPASPYATFADVVAAAKAKPGTVPYGTIGQGSLAHLAMSQIAPMLGVTWNHVPYKGGGPLVNDAVAGHIPLAISSIASIGPHAKAGKMRALAVTSPTRHPQFPDTPTLSELGVKGFEANAWWGVVVPAKTPEPIVARLHKALLAAFNDPDVKRSVVDEAGVVYELSSPAEFGKFLQAEIARWAKVIKDNKITSE